MNRAFRKSACGLAAVVPLLLVGCPVDDRFLLPEEVGAGASDGEGGAAANGASGGSGAGPADAGEGGRAAPSDGGEAGESASTGGTGGTGGAGGSTAQTGGSSGVGGSSAGASGVGGAGKGGTSGGGTSGGSGASAPCPDIDQNGTVDCDETVVSNADFDSDADEWNAEMLSGLAWNEIDARSVSNSGSVDVTNENSGGSEVATISAASQCVVVYAGTTYMFASEVFVPPGQPAGGFGALNMVFYDQPDCVGQILDSGFAPSTSNNFWQTVTLVKKGPPGAISAAIRLGAVKALNMPPYVARFDNVLFHPTTMVD